MSQFAKAIIIKIMGGTVSKQQFPQSKHYSILDYGYCKVWKRVDTHRETMEQYEIVIESQKMLQAYKRMWLFRAQEEAVVGVYYFTHRANKEICGFYQNGSILAERIPYRLSQFSNIPYEESLFILKQALSSFQLLYDQYGLFLVRSTMFGINFQKQVKVWHHTDLSAAEPENANCRSLAEMLDSIIEAVELNAEVPYYYPKFSEFLRINRGKMSLTFEEIRKSLSAYVKINRVPRCESLPKLSNYLRQAEGWQQLTYNSNFLSNLSNVNQLNKSSFGKYSFKGNSQNSSVSSSRKTLKNSPSFNIYTQKEVNQRSKEHSDMKSTKSQKLDSYQPRIEKYQYTGSPQPFQSAQTSKDSSLLRAKSIQAVNFNRNRNMLHNVSPFTASKPETISSIDKRLRESPQDSSSLYYATTKNHNFQPQFRTNRFCQNPPYLQFRNQSRSPASKMYFHRP